MLNSINKDDLLLSIIIPVYNRANHIRKCIESILAADPRNTEIVLVDDCSTDKTGDICKRYSQKYHCIRYIRNERNLGPGQSRNAGIGNSFGNFLLFLDSDDTIASENLCDVLELLKKFQQVDIIATDFDRKHFAIPDEVIESDTSCEIVLSTRVCSILYRRCFLLGNRISFPKAFYSEDIGFVARVLAYVKTVYLCDKKIYNYAANVENSLMFSLFEHMDSEVFNRLRCSEKIVIDSLLDLLRTMQSGTAKNAVERIYYHCLSWAGACLQQTVFLRENLMLEKSGVAHGVKPSPDFYTEYGFEASMTQWLRFLQHKLRQMGGAHVYFTPASPMNIMLAHQIGRLGGKIDGLLDNNCSSNCRQARLADKWGVFVYPLQEKTLGEDARIVIHTSARVKRQLKTQLSALGKVEGREYTSVHDGVF